MGESRNKRIGNVIGVFFMVFGVITFILQVSIITYKADHLRGEYDDDDDDDDDPDGSTPSFDDEFKDATGDGGYEYGSGEENETTVSTGGTTEITKVESIMIAPTLPNSKASTLSSSEAPTLPISGAPVVRYLPECQDWPSDLMVYKTGVGIAAGFLAIILGISIIIALSMNKKLHSVGLFICGIICLLLQIILIAIIMTDILTFMTLCRKPHLVFLLLSALFTIKLCVTLCFSNLTYDARQTFFRSNRKVAPHPKTSAMESKE